METGGRGLAAVVEVHLMVERQVSRDPRPARHAGTGVCRNFGEIWGEGDGGISLLGR